MWDRLAQQAEVEFEQLDHLLATHRPLIERCETTPPDDIELSALAAMLHSFYTGVENLLKRVALQVDGDIPSGEMWHRDLLDQMACETSDRPAVFSPGLRDTPRVYLDFRHVFRHAYAFDLRWEKMRDLVLECEDTLAALHEEMDAFLQEIG